jgi:hypothetical protein
MLPITTDPHLGAADALLAILADPAAHQARLDELVAQEKSTKEQIAALNEMAADTRRQNSAAQAATIVANNRKIAQDKRDAELDERTEIIEQVEARRRDAALAARELAVTTRENSVKAEAERLAAIRTDYEGRLGTLKQHLASALH